MDNGCLRAEFAGPGRWRRAGARSGFTLVEISIVLVIAAVLVTIALPSYTEYREKALVAQAKGDIGDMAIRINQYYADHRAFPATLADIGKDTLLDPWKHPYKYLALQGANVGQARKDKNLVPINSDFDLYSMGKDGKTAAPLTAKASRDDVIRANDGRFIGLGSEY
jgi:general secretion pathway protein G